MLYVVYPEELTFDERTEADKHLAKCSVCRDDYEGMKLISDMLRANRDSLRNSGVFGDTQSVQPSVTMSHEEIMDLRFQARLQRAGARRKRRERRERIAKIKRLVRPVAAVAACILQLLIVMGWKVLKQGFE